MASSLTASTATASLAPATRVMHRSHGGLPLPSPILGVPTMGKKGRVQCSMEEEKPASAPIVVGSGASVVAAAYAATMSSPALALVDERMSTEGTGLSLGLSNNLLGWILLGVFGLIWALYFTYADTLEEDEESGGLSL